MDTHPYKILDSLEDSYYIDQEKCSYSDTCLCEDVCVKRGEDYSSNDVDRKLFMQLEKHQDPKKQAGYSTKRECDYVSLMIVVQALGDGEFLGYNVRNTCLVKKDGEYKDSNDYSDVYGEYTENIVGAYHVLPDGKIVEFLIKNSYEQQIENLYETIYKLRQYYILSEKLEEKTTKSSKFKL